MGVAEMSDSEMQTMRIELERYRRLGSPEACEEAIAPKRREEERRRRTPQTPFYRLVNFQNGETVWDKAYCPWCMRRLGNKQMFCPHCGQAIDWKGI